MYVYLFLNEDTGHHKIGVSKKPERRLREEQTASPGKLIIASVFKSAHPFKLEKLIHARFREDHSRGEWFYIGIGAEQAFQAHCEHLEPYVRLRYSDAMEDEW